MVKENKPGGVFPSACDDANAAQLHTSSAQTNSPSFRLAYTDQDFLLRDELLSVRLQLELMKPDILQDEHGIHSTVVIFGSARIPEPKNAKLKLQNARECAGSQPQDSSLAREVRIAERLVESSQYYEEARKLAYLITEDAKSNSQSELVVITGGGPGVMEAANRGAQDANGESIGLNIVLPFEQAANPYITPELCFQFHYFAIRKMHFLMRARALVACPGGFGTMDELFETLTLIQTKKIKPMPVLLLGREF
jgi:uncharacterized protein (TIGR00730 family)